MKYVAIVNGRPFPSGFRPFAASSLFNTRVSDPEIDEVNTVRLQRYLTPRIDAVQNASTSDWSHPVYLASNSDPLVTYDCASSSYRCGGDGPMTAFRVPPKARPTGSADAHFAVIQPSGATVEIYALKTIGRDWRSGDVLHGGLGVRHSIFGSGFPAHTSATDGASLAAGLIRFDELTAGTIPHALILHVTCTTGLRAPATSAGFACADHGGVPMGAKVWSDLTDVQVDALSPATCPTALRPILKAMHAYGAIVNDTHGGTEGDGLAYYYESVTQYLAFGTTYPGAAFAKAHGYERGAGQWNGPGIDWRALRGHIKVIQ